MAATRYNKVKQLYDEAIEEILASPTAWQSFMKFICGQDRYVVEMGLSESGNLTRLDNVLDGLESSLAKAEQDLGNTKSNLNQAELDFAKEFAYDDQLKQLVQRQAELNLALGVDKVDDAIVEEQANTGSEKSIDHDYELEA